MTEYCTVSFSSWEPDSVPNHIVDYVFESGDGNSLNDESSVRKDHLSPLGSPSCSRLQVTQRQELSEENQHCKVTLQCKPVYSVGIVGLLVASEARTIEVYDALRGDSYLQTVRGVRDRIDSEADGSRVHFMCHCALEKPLGAVTIKFLSLGQRRSFEIAHIKVNLEPCSAPVACSPSQSQTIDIDKLRQDVDNMGDAVSDRAKSFLTTLENFQKSKHGAVDDLRHLLLDKNVTGAQGQSMAGITTLLSMFASTPGMSSSPNPPYSGKTLQPSDSIQTEGSMMNNMLSQMMSSLAVGAEENKGMEAAGDQSKVMYQFLQSVCGQVSQLREVNNTQGGDAQEMEGKTEKSVEDERATSTAELESRVTSQVEAMVESRLNAVEEHVKQMVDQRMDELENRMTSKLDAIFTLLQNSQKPS